MSRISAEMMSRYAIVKSDGCIICEAESKRLVHHPKNLLENESGIRIEMCVACYGSYKALKLDNLRWDYVFQKLSSRRRNAPPGVRFDTRWHQNLEVFLGESNQVVSAENVLTNERYDAKDVQLYFDNRALLIRQPKEVVEKWCKDNLTDQRFIIKVVSSFSK